MTPQSLPAWLYTDQHFFELEREKVFAQAWHIVGHINDLPNTGDYLTLDILGERVVTVRGDDQTIRSFHNVCRHRVADHTEARGSSAIASSALSRVELQARQGSPASGKAEYRQTNSASSQ